MRGRAEAVQVERAPVRDADLRSPQCGTMSERDPSLLDGQLPGEKRVIAVKFDIRDSDLPEGARARDRARDAELSEREIIADGGVAAPDAQHGTGSQGKAAREHGFRAASIGQRRGGSGDDAYGRGNAASDQVDHRAIAQDDGARAQVSVTQIYLGGLDVQSP